MSTNPPPSPHQFVSVNLPSESGASAQNPSGSATSTSQSANLIRPALPQKRQRKDLPYASPDIWMQRIKRDLSEFFSDPPDGIFVLTRDADITKIDAVIVGPSETPYQGGFFHFFLEFPRDYPWNPPLVRLMTTGNGKVRFNPNFYNSGKVCLSILGTWEGPRWTPSLTISSLLCTIRSIMTNKPHTNEPGYETVPETDMRVRDYDKIITHETLRVAVCDMLDGIAPCPSQLVKDVLEKEFLKHFEYYANAAEKLKSMDKTNMLDFLGGCSGSYDFTEILCRLKRIERRLLSSTASGDTNPDAQVIGASTNEYSSVHQKLANKAGVAWNSKDEEETEDTRDDVDEELNLTILSDDEPYESYEEEEDDDEEEEKPKKDGKKET